MGVLASSVKEVFALHSSRLTTIKMDKKATVQRLNQSCKKNQLSLPLEVAPGHGLLAPYCCLGHHLDTDIHFVLDAEGVSILDPSIAHLAGSLTEISVSHALLLPCL